VCIDLCGFRKQLKYMSKYECFQVGLFGLKWTQHTFHDWY